MRPYFYLIALGVALVVSALSGSALLGFGCGVLIILCTP